MSLSKQTDELIRLAVAGNEGALVRLLETLGPTIQQSLKIERQWRTMLEPSDVMQVTYLEVFMEIGRFDPSRGEPFTSWLRKIAENNLRDAIRNLQRLKRPQPSARVHASQRGDASTELLHCLGVASTTPSQFAAVGEREQRLNLILDTLPADYATAIRLYDLGGLPIDQVAERMGRSTGAVHMLRARAHDRLREAMGAESKWFSSIS